MRLRTSLFALAILAGPAGWYYFRPERLFVDRRVSEAFPVSGGTAAGGDVILAGVFHSDAHQTSGRAEVYRLARGRRVLRLTDFVTSNGPDVRVYLVPAADVTGKSPALAEGVVDLGELKGNIGDQNYFIPEETDLSRYRAVSIWCRRFAVNFGAAPLAEP